MKRKKDNKWVEVIRGTDNHLPKPHMYTNYMFKNHGLLQIDPLSAYKIMACNKHVYNIEQNQVLYKS